MSNGAWIFATGIGMAIIGSGAYAVSNSIVAIGNPGNTTTAVVTPTHQLQTVMAAPANVIHAAAAIGDACTTVYTPPPGKAIVVTQITYDIGSGTATPATDYFATLYGDVDCMNGYDVADTYQGFETETRTYPTGLPMPSIYVVGSQASDSTLIIVTGYLIPATQLPPEPPQYHGRIKGMVRR
jgi:hypothetical protein